MYIYQFVFRSNCVICLCQDKQKVFRSAYDVLKVNYYCKIIAQWMQYNYVKCRMEESCISVTCMLTGWSQHVSRMTKYSGVLHFDINYLSHYPLSLSYGSHSNLYNLTLIPVTLVSSICVHRGRCCWSSLLERVDANRYFHRIFSPSIGRSVEYIY